jgi:hypothetical protein
MGITEGLDAWHFSHMGFAIVMGVTKVRYGYCVRPTWAGTGK